MKPFSLLILLTCSLNTNAQWRKEPEKKDNAVRIIGVTYQEAVHKLIDMNYRIEKIDSNYKTVQVYLGEYQTMYLRGDTAQKIGM